MIFPSEFVAVLVSTVGGVSYDDKQIRIKLRDDLEFLDTPILRRTFAGTGGSNGDASVEGEARQRNFFYSGFVPAQLCDASKLIYLISDHWVPDYRTNADYDWANEDRFIAFDGGVPLVRESDYATIAELESVAPSSGKVRFYVVEDEPVYMRLGSSPVYDLRVTTPRRTATVPEGYLGLLISELPNIDSSEGIAIEGRAVTDANETYAEFLSDQARAFFYNIWTDYLGNINAEIFNFNYTTTSAVYDFNENNISSVSFQKILPAYKITVNHGLAYPSNYASGADDDIKAELSKTGYTNSYTFEDSSVLSTHKLAKALTIDTKTYLNILDEYSLTQKYFDLYDDKITATITIIDGDVEDLRVIDLNDVVTLTLDRFGLSAGKKMVVTAVRQDYKQNLISFKLWG